MQLCANVKVMGNCKNDPHVLNRQVSPGIMSIFDNSAPHNLHDFHARDSLSTLMNHNANKSKNLKNVTI